MLEKITVDVTRKNVKNITLRVHRDGTISMTVPMWLKEEEWHEFLDEKREWIEKALAKSAALPQYNYGYDEEHWLLGEKVHLRAMPALVEGAKRRKDVVTLHYPMMRTSAETAVAKFWKSELEKVLIKLLTKWSKKMRIEPGVFSITRTKSRWGSCNTKTHELKFSLELSAKPIECIEMVVVHELCHLLEASHSPRFHELMTKFLPDWKERQKKLNSFPREFY